MADLGILGFGHVGLRVHDLDRAMRFYRLLGFELAGGPLGPEPVAILTHPTGIELNLIVNAPDPDATNVLMDAAVKHPGYTHIALRCADVEAAAASLAEAGYPLSGRMKQPGGITAVFVRDPDRNVIELDQRVPAESADDPDVTNEAPASALPDAVAASAAEDPTAGEVAAAREAPGDDSGVVAAPIEVEPSADGGDHAAVVEAAVVEETGAVEDSAGIVDATAVPRAVDELRAGDTVSVEWQGEWWTARIVEVRDDGRFLVHYEGASDEWDEVVAAARLATVTVESPAS